jgi:hypothetical protein
LDQAFLITLIAMRPGLQDGTVYLHTKFKFWLTFKAMEWYFCVGIFSSHLVLRLFDVHIKRPFGTFCGQFGIFFSIFGLLYQEKSGNPGFETRIANTYFCLDIVAKIMKFFVPLSLS